MSTPETTSDDGCTIVVKMERRCEKCGAVRLWDRRGDTIYLAPLCAECGNPSTVAVESER